MAESEATERIKVRGYVPGDEPRVMEMIEQVWGDQTRANHAYLWKWKHERDSKRQSDGSIAQVIEVDGNVVGYSGAIPMNIKMGDRVMEGIFCMDTFTDPNSRGSGVRLMKHQLKSVPITFGAGNPRAKELWARLAKKEDPVIRGARKMVYLADPTAILVNKRVPLLLARPIGLLWRLFARSRSLRLGKSSNRLLRLERVDKFPPAIDKVCSEFSKEFRFIVVRDHGYLNWRFVSCPFEYEKWVLWKEGEPVGYMVYRVGTLNQRKIMILVEMMAVGSSKAEYYQAMLSRLHESAEMEGVADIQTLETGCKVFEGELLRRGFYYKKEIMPIIGSVHDDLLADYDIYVSDDWYLCAGDADFEVIFFNQGINSIVRSIN